jgi:hypothetical protein
VGLPRAAHLSHSATIEHRIVVQQVGVGGNIGHVVDDSGPEAKSFDGYYGFGRVAIQFSIFSE